MAFKDFVNYAIYKHRFLTRNKACSKESQEIEKQFGKYLITKTKRDMAKVDSMIHRFVERWGAILPDPGLDFSDLYKGLGSKLGSQFAYLMYRQDMRPGQKVAIDLFDVDIDLGEVAFVGEDLQKGEVRLLVNLNYSKKRLMEEFEFLLDLLKRSYASGVRKDTLKKREKIYQKKYHFENFDLYLKVWDMREKDKMSWSTITSTLRLNSPQTARNHYQAACRLIKEGIDAYAK